MTKKQLAWSLVAAGTGSALGVLYHSQRQAVCQLRQDAQQLFTAVADGPAPSYHETQLAGLPAPVQRYFRHVLPEGQPYLRGLRLRHDGQFKTDLKKDWMAIEGEQYITAAPAGFICRAPRAGSWPAMPTRPAGAAYGCACSGRCRW